MLKQPTYHPILKILLKQQLMSHNGFIIKSTKAEKLTTYCSNSSMHTVKETRLNSTTEEGKQGKERQLNPDSINYILVPTNQNEVVIIKNLNISRTHKMLPPNFIHYVHKFHPLDQREWNIWKPEHWPYNLELCKSRI